MSEQADNTSAFPPTSRTLFRRVIASLDTECNEALEEFFQDYWHPMYVFLRSKGTSHEDASDLVLGFILHELLTRDQIRNWKPDRGRLRTFLMVGLDRFRINEYHRESAQKRGGPKEQTHVSFDFEWSRDRYEQSATIADTPDLQFDREWAEVVVQKTMHVVEMEYVQRGRAKEYRILSRSLRGRSGGGRRVAYAEIAHNLRTSENNVKQKMLQLRNRYRHALSKQVAETVDESEVEEEIRYVSDLVMGRLG
ncbi:MAG: hypothetical protein ACPGVU_00470 [Limisphaerales bacterium]